MAIYKPTDMSPNQTSFSFDDVTTDEAIVFECLTDTSNTLANALSIELYSYDGEKVFGFADEQDVSSITLMTDLQQYCLTNFSSILRGYKYPNSGINGTYIKLPFAVDISKKPSSGNTLLKNQIYKTTIDGEIKFVDYDNNVLDIFEG